MDTFINTDFTLVSGTYYSPAFRAGKGDGFVTIAPILSTTGTVYETTQTAIDRANYNIGLRTATKTEAHMVLDIEELFGDSIDSNFYADGLHLRTYGNMFLSNYINTIFSIGLGENIFVR